MFRASFYIKNYMYKLPLFCLIVLLFYNCQKRNSSLDLKTDVKYFSIESTNLIDGERLHLSDSLGIPEEIKIVNFKDSSDVLALVSDITNIPPLHYVNLTKDKYISKIGREGRGPGEFLSVGSIYVTNGGEALVLGRKNLRLTKINLRNREHIENLYMSEPEIINLEYNGLPFDIFPLEDGNFAAIGLQRIRDNKNLAILDSSGKQFKLIGKLPSFDPSIPPNVHQLAWRSRATSNKEGNKFAVGYYNVDLIQLFDYLGEPHLAIRGPRDDDLKYSVENARLSLDEKTIRAYIDLTSTQDHFYVLYSGRSIKESNNNFGKHIFVFDWEGNFVRAYELDKYAFRIDVDSKNNVLYTIVPESLEPGIYKYELNNFK